MVVDPAAPGPLIGTGRAADVYDIGRRTGVAPLPDRPPARRHRAGGGGDAPPAGQRLPGARGVRGRGARRRDGAARSARRCSTTSSSTRGGSTATPTRGPTCTDGCARCRSATSPRRGLATRFGPPDAVVHLDFHPDNIMLTADGPVVFDWTNAALGPPAADVAFAWVIGATTTIDGSRWLRAVVTARARSPGRPLRRQLWSGGRAGPAPRRRCLPGPGPQRPPRGSRLRPGNGGQPHGYLTRVPAAVRRQLRAWWVAERTGGRRSTHRGRPPPRRGRREGDVPGR